MTKTTTQLTDFQQSVILRMLPGRGENRGIASLKRMAKERPDLVVREIYRGPGMWHGKATAWLTIEGERVWASIQDEVVEA